VLLKFSTSLENVMVGLPCSLRVAVVAVVVIIVVFFAVAFIFLFVFFLVWLLSKEDIGSYRPIRRVRVEAFWMYSAHAQMVHPAAPWQPGLFPWVGREELFERERGRKKANQAVSSNQ
jgi:hypothetical protein